MWISRQMNAERGESADVVEIGRVTIGGQGAAVLTDHEMRNVGVFAPGGYYWQPRAGRDIMILKCGDGTRVAVAEEPGIPAFELKSGEVCISSGGGAAIHLRNDGCVDIVGTLLNNGVPVDRGEDDG